MSPNKTCSVCGKPFSCGCESGSCWCCDYPAVMPADFSQGCRCPDCLARAIGRKIEERLSNLPHSEALKLASSQPPSARLIEHIDYTLEDGKYVFSKWFLLKQGNCCGNDCRNCPYPPSNQATGSIPTHLPT